MVNEAKLNSYLKKCELQYRADHLDPGCSDTLDWLAPHCGSVSEIAAYLRSLGFRIAEQIDEEPWPGERHQWVVTTSLVIQCVETEAMVNWCNKNGFKPIPSASCVIGGLLIGDYEKDVS